MSFVLIVVVAVVPPIYAIISELLRSAALRKMCIMWGLRYEQFDTLSRWIFFPDEIFILRRVSGNVGSHIVEVHDELRTGPAIAVLQMRFFFYFLNSFRKVSRITIDGADCELCPRNWLGLYNFAPVSAISVILLKIKTNTIEGRTEPCDREHLLRRP